MKKVRIHLTLDIPLAAPEMYPGVEIDEKHARLEWLSLMNEPGYYIENLTENGPGWISGSSYRFVDDKNAGEH